MHQQTAARLRTLCASLTLTTGGVLCAQLWYQPLSAGSLLLAGNGFVYLLLALGLFGISRFALLLAAVAAGARVASGWAPLAADEEPFWEGLRSGVDMFLVACCLWLFWVARHRPTR